MPTLTDSIADQMPSTPLDIQDPILALRASTHKSYNMLPNTPNSLDHGAPQPDYLKLEHIGDSIVGK